MRNQQKKSYESWYIFQLAENQKPSLISNIMIFIAFISRIPDVPCIYFSHTNLLNRARVKL